MAETSEKYNIPDRYRYQYRKAYESDWDIHRNYTYNFEPWEAMLMGTVYDTVTNSIDSSRITDSYATTLAKERADRVIAKLPEGQTVPFGKADIGKAAFMDILRQKWIYPNANAQHSFLEKLNMWQLYSSVYGYMPMFYDWNASPSGYVGPDCWLWNPRNLVPQQGRASIHDMEYVTALTWVSKGYLQDVLEDLGATGEEVERESNAEDPSQPENSYEDSGWDKEALKLLIEAAAQDTRPDVTQDSKIVRDRTPQSAKRGICLATRYEAGEDGEWITFAPDHGWCEVRRLKNPHKNGRIPFVVKYSQPLFDSFYGLGDFQRAKPLQFARDGLLNFYFKGIKMNLIPPIVANANGVVKHTVDYREGAVMLETIPNSIRRLETSTAGLATYQAAQDSLTGSLLSLYGSQNASISAGNALNPSQGKTPQAIDLYADKEATRDGAERRHLEDAIMQLTDGFFSLVANIGTEEIPVTLLADDVQDIIDSGLSDVKDLFKNFKANESQTAGDLKIDPKSFKDIELRFQITTDSTAKDNKQAMLTALQEFMATLGKLQNVITEDPGIEVHWNEIMQTYQALSGIPNAQKFVTFDPQASQQAKQAASQPQTPQLDNPVQLPNGNNIEMSDLVKLFDGADDNDTGFKNAILQVIGIPAETSAPPQEEAQEGPGIGQPGANIISSGNAFDDPHVAAAAEAIQGHELPDSQEQPEPMVTSSGHAFNDATIGNAAEAINGLSASNQGGK